VLGCLAVGMFASWVVNESIGCAVLRISGT
jgi:hypothetical protein